LFFGLWPTHVLDTDYHAQPPNSMGWTWLILFRFEFLWFKVIEYYYLAAVTVDQFRSPCSVGQLPL
jgi:hypothetical protein